VKRLVAFFLSFPSMRRALAPFGDAALKAELVEANAAEGVATTWLERTRVMCSVLGQKLVDVREERDSAKAECEAMRGERDRAVLAQLESDARVESLRRRDDVPAETERES
jgi:hypothetical protein